MTQYFKLQARLLSIVALTLFSSCQQTDENKLGMQASEAALSKDQLALEMDKSPTVKELDLAGIKPPPLPENYQEIVEKYQVIASSKVRPIIDTIPHGQVRLVLMDPAKKEALPLPVFFTERHGQEVMFAPASRLDEVTRWLQAYYNEQPDCDKVQLISVLEPQDWLQILKKAGSGKGEPKKMPRLKNVSDYDYKKPDDRNDNPEVAYKQDGGVNLFFYDDEYKKKNGCRWKRLCKIEWMRNAMDKIPRQEDTNTEWSCGVNSIARAIYLFGGQLNETYRNFLRNATRWNNPRAAAETGMKAHVGGMFLIICLAPFTAGGSIAAFGATLAADTITAGRLAVADIPPSLRQLARYADKYLKRSNRSKYYSYNSWKACAEAIRDSIREGDPVIVLQTFTPTHGHIVSVIGVEVDENDKPVTFMLMEVDKYLEPVKYKDMEFLMKRQFAIYRFGTNSKNYHFTRFHQ